MPHRLPEGDVWAWHLSSGDAGPRQLPTVPRLDAAQPAAAGVCKVSLCSRFEACCSIHKHLLPLCLHVKQWHPSPDHHRRRQLPPDSSTLQLSSFTRSQACRTPSDAPVHCRWRLRQVSVVCLRSHKGRFSAQRSLLVSAQLADLPAGKPLKRALQPRGQPVLQLLNRMRLVSSTTCWSSRNCLSCLPAPALLSVRERDQLLGVHNADYVPSASGWEANERGLVLPRSSNLGAFLDPKCAFLTAFSCVSLA